MLLYFSPEKKKPRIQGGHVSYKTKNIKGHNRTLNLGKKTTHIKFDSDGNPIELKPSKTLIKVRNFFGRVEMQSDLEDDKSVAALVSPYKSHREPGNENLSDLDGHTDSIIDTVNAVSNTAREMLSSDENKTSFTENTAVSLFSKLSEKNEGDHEKGNKTTESIDSVKEAVNSSQINQLLELDKTDSVGEEQERKESRRIRFLKSKLGIGDISRYFSSEISSQNETESIKSKTEKGDDSSVLTPSQQEVRVTEDGGIQICSHDEELRNVQNLSHEIVQNIVDKLLDSVTACGLNSEMESVVDTSFGTNDKKDSSGLCSQSESKAGNNVTETEFREARKKRLVIRKLGIGGISQYFTGDDNKNEKKTGENDKSEALVNKSDERSLEDNSDDSSYQERTKENSEIVSENRVTANENKFDNGNHKRNKKVGESQTKLDLKSEKTITEPEIKDNRKTRYVRSKLGVGDISQYFTNANTFDSERKPDENEHAIKDRPSEHSQEVDLKDTGNAHTYEHETESDDNYSTKSDGKKVTNLLNESLENKREKKDKIITESSTSQKYLLGGGFYDLEEELEIGKKFDPIMHSDINLDDYIDEEAYEACMAAKKKKKKRRKVTPMPPEIAGDPELRKYWGQRYRLFSKFDEGIKMDKGKKIE